MSSPKRKPDAVHFEHPDPMPRTRAAVRTVIDQADALARAVRFEGKSAFTLPEREDLASLLEALTLIARRRMDPDWEPEPDQYHGGDDLVNDWDAL